MYPQLHTLRPTIHGIPLAARQIQLSQRASLSSSLRAWSPHPEAARYAQDVSAHSR